ncbi:MAG: CinA family protein [Gammaproteobacteria bacterium]
MSDEADVPEVVFSLATALRERGWRMATAESCTGGLIAGACTEISGSSDWFDRGFITYSNQAKTEMLGVPGELLVRHGAVSAEVACAMAVGARQRSGVDCAVAVTGIAGPTGGSDTKPVGTVWLAWATPHGTGAGIQRFSGNRHAVRQATVIAALQGLLARVTSET